MSRERRKGSRDQLRGKQKSSAFIVGHRVQPTAEIMDFFSDLEKEMSVLPKVQFTNEYGRKSKPKAPVQLRNPERLRLTVVESARVADISRRRRTRPEPGDMARIQQEVVDRLGEYRIGGKVIRCVMSVVGAFGDAELAAAGYHPLSVGPSSETSEALFFAREHEISVNGLKRWNTGEIETAMCYERREVQRSSRDGDFPPDADEELGDFDYTNSYTPHMRIGSIIHGTPEETHAKAIEIIQARFPLEVFMNGLTFDPLPPRRHS